MTYSYNNQIRGGNGEGGGLQNRRGGEACAVLPLRKRGVGNYLSHAEGGGGR